MTTPSTIDRQAPVVAHHEISIDAPLETVWQLLTDVNGWTSWQKDITEAHIEGRLEPGASFSWSSFGFPVTSTVYEMTDRARALWGGAVAGITGIHEWTLESTGDGVHVVTEESFSGPLVEVNRDQMQGMLDGSLVSWLGHLKRAAEGG